MKFITSRPELPESSEEMADWPWFNMWQKSHWPINELKNGALLYWYESQSKKIVSQIIRRDTKLVMALKELCNFRCQFPDCNTRIQKRDGGYYIEVAHIEPVSQGGKSVIGNLIVLCPNHHKEFDYGDLEILEQTTEYLCGRLNGKEFEISFPSD